MRYASLLLALAMLLSGTLIAGPVSAQTPRMPHEGHFNVVPFAFEGPGVDCDVVSEWIGESAAPSAAMATSTATSTERGGAAFTGTSTENMVLLLKKGCPTSTVAAAGADIITPLLGGPVSALRELSFGHNAGGHCGIGAPRVNVVVDGTAYSLPCAAGMHSTTTAAAAAGTGTSTDRGMRTSTLSWMHVTFGEGEMRAAGIPASGTLEDLYIIFDEGTDDSTGGAAGMVLVDNISVNGHVEGMMPKPLLREECRNGGYEVFGFRNQGLCIASIVSAQGGLQNGGTSATTTGAANLNAQGGTTTGTTTNGTISSTSTATGAPEATSTGTNGTGGAASGTGTPAGPGMILTPNPNGSFSGSGYRP